MSESSSTPSTPSPLSRLSLGFLAFVAHTGIAPVAGGLRSAGLDAGMDLIARGEELGYDSAYVRTRHLQTTLASPLPFLAAVGQRVPRIGLGTQVIPLRFESPGRLAEDLATTDLLLGGRLLPGISSGYSRHDAGYVRAFGETRGGVREHVDRVLGDLVSFLDGEIVSLADEHVETMDPGASQRVQPQVPTLRERLAYGAAGPDMARRAGRAGLRLQLATLQPDDGTGRSFEDLQVETIRAYREASREAGHGRGHVSVGRQMVPITAENELEHDPAMVDRDRSRTVTIEQEHRGREIGGGDAVFGRVVVDSPEEVARALHEDAAVREADELVLTLPVDQDPGKVRRILEIFAQEVMPQLRG